MPTSSRSSDLRSASIARAKAALLPIRECLPKWNQHVATIASHRSLAVVIGEHDMEGRFFADYSPIVSLLAGCPQQGLFYEPARTNPPWHEVGWGEDDVVLEFTVGQWLIDASVHSQFQHPPSPGVYRLMAHGFGQDRVIEMLEKAQSRLYYDSASSCLANRANFVHRGVRPGSPHADLKISFSDIGEHDTHELPKHVEFPRLLLTGRGAKRIKAASHGSPIEVFIPWRGCYKTDAVFKAIPGPVECEAIVGRVNAAIQAKNPPWVRVTGVRSMADICEWVDSSIATEGLVQTFDYHGGANHFVQLRSCDDSPSTVGRILNGSGLSPTVMALDDPEALRALWNFRRDTFSDAFPARETWDLVSTGDHHEEPPDDLKLRRLVLSRTLPHTMWHVYNSPDTGDDPGRTCLPASKLTADMKCDLKAIISCIRRQLGVTAGVAEIELLSGPNIKSTYNFSPSAHIDGEDHTMYLNVGVLLDYANSDDRDNDRDVERMTTLTAPYWYTDANNMHYDDTGRFADDTFPYDVYARTLTTVMVGNHDRLAMRANPHRHPAWATYDRVSKEYEKYTDPHDTTRTLQWDSFLTRRLTHLNFDVKPRPVYADYCHFGQFWVFNGSLPHRSPCYRDTTADPTDPYSDEDESFYGELTSTSERRWLFFSIHFTGIHRPATETFEEFAASVKFSDQVQCTHLLDYEIRVNERRATIDAALDDILPEWAKRNVRDLIRSFVHADNYDLDADYWGRRANDHDIDVDYWGRTYERR